MPVYLYRCRSCEETFEVRHSMSEEQEKCTLCGSESIFRVPSLTDVKIPRHLDYAHKSPGKIVDQYIIDTKKQIKKEKDKLRKEEL